LTAYVPCFLISVLELPDPTGCKPTAALTNVASNWRGKNRLDTSSTSMGGVEHKTTPLCFEGIIPHKCFWPFTESN
jgi:hypothetical protein